MIAQEHFLAKFNPDLTTWEEPVPGRAAGLRLKGNMGALDIWVVYFATGIANHVHTPLGEQEDESLRRQRQHMRIRMASYMSHPNCTLSVTAGDFNWVASPKDRISKDCALESRSNDAAEEQLWKHTVANPFKIPELN